MFKEEFEGKIAKHTHLTLADVKSLMQHYVEDIEATAADLLTDNTTIGLTVSVTFHLEG